MAKYDSKCYFNRELSWLEFDDRVLSQAVAPENPLGERLKFLSIVVSNLDEFYMIRAASIKDQQRSGYDRPDPSGMTPKEQLTAISARVRQLYARLYDAFRAAIDELSGHGIRVLSHDQLTDAQTQFCKAYFHDTIYPAVSPAALAKGRKHPFVPNKGLNIAVSLKNPDGERSYATMQLPVAEGRLIELPSADGTRCLIPVEELVRFGLKKLFHGRKLEASCVYRVTRNGDVAADAEEAEDLLSAVKQSLVRRKRGAVIRLETERQPDERLLRLLQKEFNVGSKGTFELDGPVDLTFLSALAKLPQGEGMRYLPFSPQTPSVLGGGESIFAVLRRGDVLLHHPFDAFEPVVRMIAEAADDPAVTAIKITLYRLSEESPIAAALARAARHGKQVTAFIESRARFDEENNIEYGAELERAGVSVIYGLPKYKTHSKIALVLRREEGGLRKYTHLGTGNYNDVTARLYTDFSLLTASMAIGADGVEFFHCVAGSMREPDLEHLVMAPFSLRERLYDEIARQRKLARRGEPAAIFAKMNALVDEGIIAELYDASRDGVAIRLLVRGMCSLRPGVKGMSESIEVRSIVGRFLEHSRVFCFGAGESAMVYLSSADWMTRNLSRRVELMFPLLSERTTSEVRDCMELYWSDNVKARKLCADGSYLPLEPSGEQPRLNAQDRLINRRTQPQSQ